MNMKRTYEPHDHKKTNPAQAGFILPALVVFSLVLMSIGMVALQYISASTGSVQANHYTSVAKSAADAGAQQAISCIKSGNTDWALNDTTLHPNTGCDGVVDPDLDTAITRDPQGLWRSTFEVADIDEGTEGMTITSTGRVEFFYAGSSTPSKTFTSSTKVSVPTTNVNEVRPIAQGTAVTKVSAGDNFTCAIANQQVYCSGTQNHGRMGNGVSTILNPFLNPTQITSGGLSGGKKVSEITSGYYNTCAVADGNPYCWGWGNMGQLGNNSTNNWNVPTKPNNVAGYSSYAQKASPGTSGTGASQYMCFLTQMKVYCTGANDYAQRGRPVANRICLPWPFGCGAWYLESKAFFTTGFPHFVDAGTLTPERVFGLDVSNEPSHMQGLANQSQLYGTRPTDVDAGAYTACALTNARVFCWGDRFILANALGNDENGNTTSTKGWRDNGSMAGKRATAMDIGESTSCLVSNGELHCWGNTVGDGTQKTPSTIIPGWNTMAVSKASNGPGSALYDVNVEGVSMMADGIYCAYGDGDAFCWGGNTISTHVPVRIISGTTGQDSITDAASGLLHACFVANGSQYCRGHGTYGQLGTGDTSGHLTTANTTRKSNTIGLTAGEAATQISNGENHSCAVANGYIYCWGRNHRGQLGVGDTVDRDQPHGIVNVTKPKAATQVSAGAEHSCGIISGMAFCWGDNTYGQLGNGTSGGVSDEPVAVQGLGSRKVTSIDAGRYHTCAVADGQAFCWGRNNQGQLGIGASTSNQTAAQAVQGLGSDVPTQITTGDMFSCAVANARGYCWGDNTYGQIGRAASPNVGGTQRTATRVDALDTSDFSQMSAGKDFVCAIIIGTAHCWGNNASGQLGRTSTTGNQWQALRVASPVDGKYTTEITAGDSHACSISNGVAYCWGNNTNGKLGDGSTATRNPAVAVTAAPTMLGTNYPYKISAGSSGTCAIANGKIACWGGGGFGQLGDDTNTPSRTTPTGWTADYIRQHRTIDLPNMRMF